MKIATTTGDFAIYCNNDSDRIRELYNAGFRNIDLNMYTFKPSSPYMQDGWKDEVKRIKEVADSLGMTFVQAHSQGGNYFCGEKKQTDFLVAATLRSIEICEILGIKNTVVHNGVIKDATKEEWFEKNREYYRILLPAAEKHGVNILCENSTAKNMGSNYFINNGKDMREFIKFVDHPLVHGCWDTGHANCEGNQYDEIMALGDEMYAIHYNDNRGGGDEHVAPFLGTLNHDEVINALIDSGYKGYFTLECDSSLRKSKYWQGNRREFEKDTRLAEPQLFMQRHIEKMMYETAEWMLDKYGLFEI